MILLFDASRFFTLRSEPLSSPRRANVRLHDVAERRRIPCDPAESCAAMATELIEPLVHTTTVSTSTEATTTEATTTEATTGTATTKTGTATATEAAATSRDSRVATCEMTGPEGVKGDGVASCTKLRIAIKTEARRHLHALHLLHLLHLKSLQTLAQLLVLLSEFLLRPYQSKVVQSRSAAVASKHVEVRAERRSVDRSIDPVAAELC